MSVIAARRSGFGTKIAIKAGPGDGKTYTSLLIASFLADDGRERVKATSTGYHVDRSLEPLIALVETEDRGREYCEGRPFWYSIEEPEDCSPKSFLRALESCKRRGVRVVVIDSYTDEWRGRNGCLEQAGNEFQKWASVKDDHWDLLAAILAYPGYVIVTLRVKEKFAMTKESGRTTVQNLGFQAEQEKFIEYRFPVVMEMDEETGVVTKTACDTLQRGQIFKRPGYKFAEAIRAWTKSAVGDKSAFEIIREHIEASVAVTQADLIKLGPEYVKEGFALDVVVNEIGTRSEELTEREVARLREIYKAKSREIKAAALTLGVRV